MILSKKTRYLQIALNSTIEESRAIIRSLPPSDRIIIEVGTPLIKSYGTQAIKIVSDMWIRKFSLASPRSYPDLSKRPYIVADLKTMDRADTEVEIAKFGGASAAICLGQAPIETINRFIETCRRLEVDSMIDMMNIEFPNTVLRKLKKLPNVVMLHRGVDEENFNKDKPIPFIQINKILSSYDVLISIAGGDTVREVQRAVFNGANIVVVWKEFYHSTADTLNLAEEFLKEVK